MHSKTAATATALFIAALSAPVTAQEEVIYEVEVTNVTRGESFTPILLASHKSGLRIFEAGEPASGELEVLAEEGNVVPLEDLLMSMPSVLDTADSGAVLSPGDSITMHVATRGDFDHVSMAAMLIPTNDGFFGLTDIAGPRGNQTIVLYSPAYDAGTEVNTESCADIPGPPAVCSGMGSPAEGGVVHIHSGIHGVGDLAPSGYDWRNPVAQIRISRVPAPF